MVALLALEEAGIQTLRLVLWSYDWIVVVVTEALLLRVCAHHRKVDGSNLHMWNVFVRKQCWYIYFSQLEKDFFDNDCRCLT